MGESVYITGASVKETPDANVQLSVEFGDGSKTTYTLNESEEYYFGNLMHLRELRSRENRLKEELAAVQEKMEKRSPGWGYP